MKRMLLTTFRAALVAGAVTPAFVWARADNGWIKFGDNQPVSPQTGMIDCGGGRYFVADGWSIRSMTLKCWPTIGAFSERKTPRTKTASEPVDEVGRGGRGVRGFDRLPLGRVPLRGGGGVAPADALDRAGELAHRREGLRAESGQGVGRRPGGAGVG